MRVHAVIAIAEFRSRSLLKWRARLERARVAFGVRPDTVHVTDGEWLEHWRAGMDPVGAVLAELRDGVAAGTDTPQRAGPGYESAGRSLYCGPRQGTGQTPLLT